MFIQLAKDQKFYDKLSIGISIACIMHCLLFPSLLILFSSFLSLFINGELVHYLLLILVAPVSIFALSMGLKNHKNFLIFLTGLIGLSNLIFALFIPVSFFGLSGEVLFTIIGSTLITAAHYSNYRLCVHIDCDCHE